MGAPFEHLWECWLNLNVSCNVPRGINRIWNIQPQHTAHHLTTGPPPTPESIPIAGERSSRRRVASKSRVYRSTIFQPLCISCKPPFFIRAPSNQSLQTIRVAKPKSLAEPEVSTLLRLMFPSLGFTHLQDIESTDPRKTILFQDSTTQNT